MMFVLDSLGMLSTSKEIEDSEAGKETRDMTRAQVVKSIFRVLTLKLGKANVPLLVTNHTYDVVGAYIPTKEMEAVVDSNTLHQQLYIYQRRRKKMVRRLLEILSGVKPKVQTNKGELRC